MNRPTLIIVATQHLDVAWMWRRSPEGEDLMIACFRRAVDLLDRHPEAGFMFSRSTVWSFAVLERREPELFERVRDYVRAGRIECTGGQWVEPDNMVPSGESHIRQLLYGQLYLLERFGVKARVCWAPDVFGHGNSLPQILSECGIDAYYSHRREPLDDDGNKMTVFRWASPDGSEVLFLGGHWYGMPDQATATRAVDTSPVPVAYAVTGLHSDRRVTMNDSWIEQMTRLQEGGSPFSVRWGGVEELPAAFSAHRLPLLHGDLGGYQFTGTYTTDGHIKGWNRRLETRLADLELLQCICLLNDRPFHMSAMREARQDFCVNQFHDIACGSCYESVHREAYDLFQSIDQRLDRLEIRMLTDLSDCAVIDQNEELAVWNPRKVPEGHPVIVGGNLTDVGIASANGEISSQVLTLEDGGTLLVFYPDGPVPATGFSTYKRIPASEPHAPVDPQDLALENRFIRAAISASSGEIVSLVEKSSGREFVEPGGAMNRLVFHEDCIPKRNAWPQHTWESWYIHYTGRSFGPAAVTEVTRTASGPIAQSIRVTREILLPGAEAPSRFVQELILFRDSPVLTVRTHGEWHGRQVMARAEFDLAFAGAGTVAEMPYGVIRRELDLASATAETEYNAEDETTWEAGTQEPDRPMQRWVEYEGSDCGLAILNDGKYGYDSGPQRLGLSLMRAPDMRQNEINGLGPFLFTYALYPHAGSWQEASVHRWAAALNGGYMVTEWNTRAVAPPRFGNVFSIDDPEVLIGAVKPAEVGDGVILRLWEPTGIDRTVRLGFSFAVKQVVVCNALEEPHEHKRPPEIPAEGGVCVNLSRFEVLTLRVTCRGDTAGTHRQDDSLH